LAGTANQQAALPDPQTAYQNVFDGVAQRVFFHKLAQLGHVPRTQKQASDLLDLAGKLRLVEEEAAVKQAEDAYDPFAAANSALDQVLAQAGFGSVKAAAEQDELMSMKQAASIVMQDPLIYDSVLALKAHEADSYAAMAAQGR